MRWQDAAPPVERFCAQENTEGINRITDFWICRSSLDLPCEFVDTLPRGAESLREELR
jgi:hypothetical protein